MSLIHLFSQNNLVKYSYKLFTYFLLEKTCDILILLFNVEKSTGIGDLDIELGTSTVV